MCGRRKEWPCVVTWDLAWVMGMFHQGSRTWPGLQAGTLVVADCGDSKLKDWRFYTPPIERKIDVRPRRGFASLNEWERYAKMFVNISRRSMAASMPAHASGPSIGL